MSSENEWRDLAMLETLSNTHLAKFVRDEKGKFGAKIIELDRAVIETIGPFETFTAARNAAKDWKPR